jgi:hypothetical protein
MIPRQKTIEEILEEREKEMEQKEKNLFATPPRTTKEDLAILFGSPETPEEAALRKQRLKEAAAETWRQFVARADALTERKEKKPVPDPAAATHRPVPVNQKSVKQLLHSLLYKKKKLPHPFALAEIAQGITIEQRLHDLKQVAAQLGCEVKTRKEITGYRTRHAKAKIRIGKNSYYLIPRQT